MNDKGRLEAFTDGILAIAITLLALDLKLPPGEAGKPLGEALLHHWPSYLAYLVSFLVIGIIWVNHHAMFSLISGVDRGLLFLNLLLMLVVAAIPFPTALFAEHLTEEDDSHIAAALYSGMMVAMSLCFIALWRWVITHPNLLHGHVDLEAARGTSRRFGLGILIYLATVGLAFVSGIATLLAHLVIALYYCFDQLAVRGTTEAGDDAAGEIPTQAAGEKATETA
ncbi:TMEM175 family protein [Actinoplanes sp. NPDC026623]|uniref:TMEM175 family protein n=1 Tax=Actinoplanes sp. NPDC026623 TaxID=3155610 RepID=UPI0033C13BA0